MKFYPAPKAILPSDVYKDREGVKNCLTRNNAGITEFRVATTLVDIWIDPGTCLLNKGVTAPSSPVFIVVNFPNFTAFDAAWE